jgi:hypothetical protein
MDAGFDHEALREAPCAQRFEGAPFRLALSRTDGRSGSARAGGAREGRRKTFRHRVADAD